MVNDPKKAAQNKHAGRGGNNVSLHPLTPDQAIAGMFNIAPADLKRIIAKQTKSKKKK